MTVAQSSRRSAREVGKGLPIEASSRNFFMFGIVVGRASFSVLQSSRNEGVGGGGIRIE
jgi:hypothetical protein